MHRRRLAGLVMAVAVATGLGDRAVWATVETSQRGTFQTRWSRDAGEYFVAVVPATLRD